MATVFRAPLLSRPPASAAPSGRLEVLATPLALLLAAPVGAPFAGYLPERSPCPALVGRVEVVAPPLALLTAAPVGVPFAGRAAQNAPRPALVGRVEVLGPPLALLTAAPVGAPFRGYLPENSPQRARLAGVEVLPPSLSLRTTVVGAAPFAGRLPDATRLRRLAGRVEVVAPPLPLTAAARSFTSLLASNSLDLRLLCHMEPYDPNALATTDLYYSTHGFTSQPGDSPSNKFYDERMQMQFGFKRSLFSQGKVSGRSIPGFADLVFNNNDGSLDTFNNLAWGARRVRIYAGGKDWALPDYSLIFDGTMQNISFGDTDVTVHLRDLQYLLDLEIQSRVFAGSGGAEGGTDVINKRKPLPYGPCANVAPIYLGADTGYHKFAVGDGRAIVGVLRVRDRGVELDYTSSSTPLAGQWTADLATGVITLAVFDGPVTVDVIGRRYLSTTSASSVSVAAGSKTFAIVGALAFSVGMTVRIARTSALGTTWMDGLVTAYALTGSLTVNVTSTFGSGTFSDWTIAPWGTVAGILQAIASDLGITLLNSSSFTALATAQPATAYKWIPEGGNGLQILDEFVNGFGGFYGFDPISRQFEVGRVVAPASPIATYTDAEILPDSFHRVETSEPNYQVVYRYRKNHSALSTADIAGDSSVVSDADRVFLTAEWRWQTVTDAAVQTAYPLSVPIEIDGVFYDSADASTEATRLLALFGVKRDYYTFDVKIQRALTRDINDVVTVKRDVSARFGLTSGSPGVVLDLDVDFAKLTTNLGTLV